jgi:hypothetical protein
VDERDSEGLPCADLEPWVLQAVTSAAQTVTDADTAHEMEGVGIRAMELAAAYARTS